MPPPRPQSPRFCPPYRVRRRCTQPGRDERERERLPVTGPQRQELWRELQEPKGRPRALQLWQPERRQEQRVALLISRLRRRPQQVQRRGSQPGPEF